MMCIHCETGEEGSCQCQEVERLRLTDEERAAISWAIAGLLNDADDTKKRGMAQRWRYSSDAAETLKGLLERHVE
jgi:hypothetical protein